MEVPLDTFDGCYQQTTITNSFVAQILPSTMFGASLDYVRNKARLDNMHMCLIRRHVTTHD